MWLDANKNEFIKTGRGLDLAPGIKFADVGSNNPVNLGNIPNCEQGSRDATWSSEDSLTLGIS